MYSSIVTNPRRININRQQGLFVSAFINAPDIFLLFIIRIQLIAMIVSKLQRENSTCGSVDIISFRLNLLRRLRLQLAQEAFAHTADYDTAIKDYLAKVIKQEA